ncbi:MAG: type II toxin-antitoxin system PemK/MazF family toxin [Gemmatimonadaceae bacterium]
MRRRSQTYEIPSTHLQSDNAGPVTAGPAAPDLLERWDVVIVPFPFTDRAATKRRPALVLSSAEFNASGHCVLAMITTAAHASWPSDVTLTSTVEAGLRNPSVVRWKIFTLDTRLILRRAGALVDADMNAVQAQLRSILP